MKLASAIRMPSLRRSIKVKLVGMLMTGTVVSLIFTGSLILSYETSRTRKNLIRYTQGLADVVGSASTAALTFNDTKTLNEYLSSLVLRSDIFKACIYDDTGKVQTYFSQVQGDTRCPKDTEQNGYFFVRNQLRLFSPIFLDKQRIGTIFVATNLSYLRAELKYQYDLIFWTALAAILLSIIISGLIQRSVSAPLLQLATTAQLVSKTRNYSIRARVANDDEIGKLTVAFNDMMAQIEGQNDSLRETTEILHAILNSMGDGVIVLDPSSQILVWNKACGQILGPVSHAALENWPKVYGLYRSDQKTLYASEDIPLTRAMNGQIVEQEEIFMRREPDKACWLSVTANPLIIGQQGRRGAVAVVRDVTERKRADEERTRLLQEAQEAVRLRDEFMSIASHELKTPLTPLKTQVQLLQRLARSGMLQALPPEKVTEIMRFTDSQLSRLVSLVEDLLDVTRITAGKLRINRESVDLNSLVPEVIDRYKQEILQSGSKLELRLTGDLKGSLDRLRIEQVLVNLLTNALKYGQGMPISISTFRRDDHAVLTISDQGVGIRKEDQFRIFNRFERAVSVSHYGGLGLGLYITQQIVEAHGGVIKVESSVGCGSTFTVELPLS